MSTRINRITLLPLLFVVTLLIACSTPKYYSDDFEKDSFRNHLSSKSHLFEDVAPILTIKRNKGDIDIPLWQVRELDIELAYDSQVDDLVILDLHAIDANGNYGLIDERCYRSHEEYQSRCANRISRFR